MKNILVKKAAVIFGLIIILMIALSMTSDVISERSRFNLEKSVDDMDSSLFNGVIMHQRFETK